MITANYNTFVKSSTSGSDSYKALPFDTIDPEVYKTRSDRYELVRTILIISSFAKQGHAEKWNNFTRAYWCITCSYCGKEVRFCSMCQGELIPVDKKDDEDKALKKLQCTECHRVINMRFCSACGHQFREEGIDAHMEIPGVNADVKEHSGVLYTLSTFNRMKKSFVRIHNQFLYIYSSIYSNAPNTVVSMEKAIVEPYIIVSNN